MQGFRDPRSLALDHFIRVDKLICEAGSGKAVRSRVREAPSIILDSGFAGFMTFYASKSSSDLAQVIHEVLVSGGEPSKIKDTLGDERYEELLESMGSEGGGYDVILALVTAFLEANGLLEQGEDYLKRIANTVKKVLEQPGYSAAVTRLVLDYLEYLKRLVEARVREEE